MGGIFARAPIVLAALAILIFTQPASAGTVTYTYDEQARVTSAAYSDGTLLCYGYDAASNRRQIPSAPIPAR